MADLDKRRSHFPHIAVFEENLYHCASCNYCVDAVWDEWGIDHVCATLRHHSPAHGYSGKGYIAAARAWFEGADLDPDSLAERAFTCTTCGNCDEVCPIGMHPSGIAVALRAELVDRGHVPAFAVALRDAALQDVGLQDVDLPAPDTPDPLAHAAADTLGFLAGCATCGDDPDESRAALRLLQVAGAVRPVASGASCGASLAALGFVAEAAERAGALKRHLAAAGVARVAVAGAQCLAHLASEGTAAGSAEGPALESPLTLVLDAVRAESLVLTPRADNPPPTRVGYLDSCHLTKKAHGLAARGLAGQARDLLARLGIAVVEPSAAPRFQICCGAAGGMPQSKPDAARRMAEARLDDYARPDRPGAGADVVVTASALCAGHLARSAGAGHPAVQGLYTFLLAHFDAKAGRVQG